MEHTHGAALSLKSFTPVLVERVFEEQFGSDERTLCSVMSSGQQKRGEVCFRREMQ